MVVLHCSPYGKLYNASYHHIVVPSLEKSSQFVGLITFSVVLKVSGLIWLRFVLLTRSSVAVEADQAAILTNPKDKRACIMASAPSPPDADWCWCYPMVNKGYRYRMVGYFLSKACVLICWHTHVCYICIIWKPQTSTQRFPDLIKGDIKNWIKTRSYSWYVGDVYRGKLSPVKHSYPKWWI